VSATPQDVLTFWRNAGPKRWFGKDWRFDDAIRLRFEPVHHAAARGVYDAWADDGPEAALALLLLLDQFPRNLYRDSAHAWATDPKARAVARGAVDRGWMHKVEPELRGFFMLPFEHSEDLADQELSLALAAELEDPDLIKWAAIHHDVIARFGRFPHRNPALGRATTPEERAFLEDGGFAG
jgi:uncharacterized protein (DUF924 family)